MPLGSLENGRKQANNTCFINKGMMDKYCFPRSNKENSNDLKNTMGKFNNWNAAWNCGMHGNKKMANSAHMSGNTNTL